MSNIIVPNRRIPKAAELIHALIPERDRWALTPEGRVEKLRAVANQRQLTAEFLMENTDEAKRARGAIAKKVFSSPDFFFRNLIWTQDPEQRMGLGQDLPYIPFTYTMKRRPAPPGYGDGRPLGGWVESWALALREGKRARLCHTKSRRARYSITISGFNVWGLRCYPGWKSIVGSDEEGAVDNAAGDWNSILGKMRYMWDMCCKFYPWLWPELTALSKSPFNKQNYIKFPPNYFWPDGTPRDEAMWSNEIAGVLPSEVAAEGILDWPTDAVHHLMDPVLLAGLGWDPGASYRGPWSQRWRTNAYAQALREEDPSAIARNWDINPMDTAAAPVFLTWTAEQVSSEDPTDDSYDLYNPDLPLYIWADIGWGDPWACWWVQTSDATGEVNILDFWMRGGVHAEWWLPLWNGWNPDLKLSGKTIDGGRVNHWRNSPERMPWKEAVPQAYTHDDLEIMRYWHGKVRPEAIIIDASGKQHHGASRWSVVERLQQGYNMKVWPVTLAHHYEDMISHANMVLRRARLSGRIAKRRPKSGGKVFPAANGILSNWRRLESSERGSPAKPIHDVHSHGGTAVIYGCSVLPPEVDARGKPGAELITSKKRIQSYRATDIRKGMV
jgi:hypothetical protein